MTLSFTFLSFFNISQFLLRSKLSWPNLNSYRDPINCKKKKVIENIFVSKKGCTILVIKRFLNRYEYIKQISSISTIKSKFTNIY